MKAGDKIHHPMYGHAKIIWIDEFDETSGAIQLDDGSVKEVSLEGSTASCGCNKQIVKGALVENSYNEYTKMASETFEVPHSEVTEDMREHVKQHGSIRSKINEAYEMHMRTEHGMAHGCYRWDLAMDFFNMSNDMFFEKYGFNFIPRGKLFDEAKRFKYEGAPVDAYRVKATEMFNTAYEAVTPEQRRMAKAHMFTEIYGGKAQPLNVVPSLSLAIAGVDFKELERKVLAGVRANANSTK